MTSLNTAYTVSGEADLWKGHDNEEVVGKRKGKDLKGKARKVMYNKPQGKGVG